MTLTLICWIYLILLLAGGLMGFIKAGSKASLIASSICGIPVLLCALGVLNRQAAIITFSVLAALFVVRFAKGRKFMPNGLMALLSILALLGILGIKPV